ncbi:C-terminal binding protein [Haliangium sp.]|uniref:C-terminal binding protein n=1 Tax=Haliangium sp. TaxID=2663208 RepID=UPI003D0D6771
MIDPGYEHFDRERAVLAPVDATLALAPCGGDPVRIAAAAADADAVLVREAPIPAQVIDAMRRCRVIVRYGVGVDNIDLDRARARHIYVSNVPDYGADEVSEHALALIMAVARRVVTRDRDVRRGAWGVGQREKMFRVRGRVLGLVGCGRIARALHRKMQGLGIARTLGFDPYIDAVHLAEDGVEAAPLARVLAEADLVSLHAPLTPDTRHIIDQAGLARMKPTAILINTARGGLVDQAALAEALGQGRLFGAGLDVFDTEPPGRGEPLLGLDQVVVSDHTGWYSEESVAELQTKAAEEVARVLAGQPPQSWLNRWDDDAPAHGAELAPASPSSVSPTH